MHRGQFWPFSKCCHFSNIRCFLERCFCTQQFECSSRIVFRTFLAFLIFDPNWSFCKGYSLCVVANFGHFQNALIFPILGVFWQRFFWTRQLQCGSRIVSRTFWTFFIFDPNWPFCKGYSLCVVANFGHFQNALSFRILGLFRRGFLHTTPPM